MPFLPPQAKVCREFALVAESIPSECVVESQIEAGIDADLDNIIAALTRPLTAEERSPQSQRDENNPPESSSKEPSKK